MPAARFLREYWQKRPLLVRGAFPGFADPLGVREVLALAQSPDAESRIVKRAGPWWSLEHGPFTRKVLERRPRKDWTVLVQDTNHFSAAAAALLARFSFIPHARVDDLMVSYAVPGGTVGPHVDSYDVFLIQGTGRRHWQVSGQRDLDFVPGLDLKILARFEPEEEWVLEAGDMLYLPPDVAHYGIAQSECLTWSVGFRAPSDAEIAAGFLDYLGERLDLAGRHADPDLKPARGAGRIPAELVEHVAQTLDRIRWSGRDALEFAGRFLSEPKGHVYFTPRARPLPRARFEAAAARRGLVLDRRARLLYAGGMFFLNGEAVSARGPCAAWLRKLADSRTLETTARAPSAFRELAHEWHSRGVLHLGEEKTP
ncbi:MAG: cupin domain-containing protein [Betaproteobacteria bacterium]|nr:cupin domain-containing protein [Betaproteobacteria bacterium]